MVRLIKALMHAACALMALTAPAAAQGCAGITLSSDVFASWSNPKPDPDDFILPGPAGMPLIFTRVDLGKAGLYGDEKTTYKMGADKKVFETPLDVRVASPIIDAAGNSVLLIGKYELSKAQYVYIMGGGQLGRGVEALASRTKDERVLGVLLDYVAPESKCKGVLTKPIADLLSEPITYLSYRDYVEVLDVFNLFCIGNRSCADKLAALSRNPDYPGFVRLPTEHEWEFVARGGEEFIAGTITRQSLQTDVPAMPSGTFLQDFAHLGNEPQRLLPIGSRKKLFGFYDVIGNAGELMLNPFTAENGFGAVGAYVSRGGSYRLPSEQFRISMRDEQPAFRRDDVSKSLLVQNFPYVGIRLALGLPVIGSTQRTGSTELNDQFVATYQAISETGDPAGNNFANAKDLGVLTGNGAETVERLSDDDTEDFFSLTLNEYAALEIEIKPTEPLTLSVLDEADTLYGTLAATKPQKSLTTRDLLPGRYFLRLASNGARSPPNRYTLSVRKKPTADTGIARPESAALASALPLASGYTVTGFIGAGDRADTYPVIMNDARAGMSISVSELKSPVTLIYLDERQQIVASATSEAGKTAFELAVPVAQGSRGFVQVVAAGNGSTGYRLTISPKKLFDEAFSTTLGQATRQTVARRAYPGMLTPQGNRLFLPITLNEPAKLRIELTGLLAAADMEVIDSNGNPATSDHKRPGTQDEVFAKDLESGKYTVRVQLASGALLTPFNLYFSTEEFSGARTFDPATARANATELTGIEFDNLKRGEAKYFKITVSDDRALLIADLFGFSAASDLDLYVEGHDGGVIGKSTNSGSAQETIRATVERGTYYLRVAPSGTASQNNFTINVDLVTEMKDPDLSWMGSFVESHDDWTIYSQGGKCYAVTIAQNVEPDIGWRPQKPYFYIGVERADASIWIALDQSTKAGGDTTYKNGEVSVQVDGRYVPGEFEGRQLKPLTRRNCASNSCIDSDAIRSFRNGHYLEITGADPVSDGRVAVSYSLSGYTKSAQRINQICGARANWVWNK
ncbi:SUMF1/EgtB/PvdO family nonheme iron enzyme [Ancylobacter sp. TS-1]|uniref:SUMF1/EgtB/PvdO family nonheme iron enzyme n=1 Tax=Ancylobacter sp. TS-1 TaxID=1850374 RepID=UPI001265D728|nr:SUMF1/EgtB/PvdO family nonheme iron enzyme [Ancylobacter sp. TS-1]QFR33587.1 SUMF1/EgtB/PvdO family nonheme iron enzyme [Ancylobacter sp. TS-1]